MAELREAGLTCKVIASEFRAAGTDISPEAVEQQCLRIGADLPPHRRRPRKSAASAYWRGRAQVRPFTAQEDAILIALELAGHGYSAIARHLDPPRAPRTVQLRLLTLARRQAREDEAA